MEHSSYIHGQGLGYDANLDTVLPTIVPVVDTSYDSS